MEFNLFISSVDKIIGMPNPSEYSKSKIVPFNIVPETDASINAEPKNAPTQGVKFIEKIMPKRTFL